MNSTREKKVKTNLSQRLVICLICLVVAVFVSTLALILSLTGQIKKTDELKNPVLTSIWMFILFVVPLLVWFIVLIVKKANHNKKNKLSVENSRLNSDEDYKRLIVGVEHFTETQTKSAHVKTSELYNDTTGFVSEASKINNSVENFYKNTKLIKLVKNYCATHEIPIRELEFACLPLSMHNSQENGFPSDKYTWGQYAQRPKYELVRSTFNSKQQSDYFDYVRQFSNEMLLDNFVKVDNAYHLRSRVYNNRPQNLIEEFADIFDLYRTLVDQGFIVDDIYSYGEPTYYGFLYVIYKCDKERYYHSSTEFFERYHIDVNLDKSRIVKELLDNDHDNETIATMIWSLESKKKNFNDLICVDYEKCLNETKILVKDFKQKMKINSLLKYNEDKKTKYTLEDIDLMSGEEFEEFVTYLFNQLGYNATKTKTSGDQGVDVIAIKGGVKVAIQTKCYSKFVSNSAVQEVVSGSKYYDADKAMVVTNNYFTKSAKELAKKNGVILWDRNVLKEKLEQI